MTAGYWSDFDVENIHYCVSKVFDFRLDVTYVCGVVQSPKDGSKTSVCLGLVLMKLIVFLCESFYYCCVFVGGFRLDFGLVAMEHLELETVSRATVTRSSLSSWIFWTPATNIGGARGVFGFVCISSSPVPASVRAAN